MHEPKKLTRKRKLDAFIGGFYGLNFVEIIQICAKVLRTTSEHTVFPRMRLLGIANVLTSFLYEVRRQEQFLMPP